MAFCSDPVAHEGHTSLLTNLFLRRAPVTGFGRAVDLSELAEGSLQWEDALSDVRRAAESRQLHGDLVDLARLAPTLMSNRREAVAFTNAVAVSDLGFSQLIAEADRERDAGRWEAAEIVYSKALSAYPLFAGYRVQYAHCLKEQDKHDCASLEYYSSLALGARESDVLPHLRHSLSRLSRSLNLNWISYCHKFWIDQDASPHVFSWPPCRADIELLIELLHNRGDVNAAECLDVLSTNRNIGDVLLKLISQPSFVIANRLLVRLIAETSKSQATR
jgi:hypothetical protein